MGHLLICGAAGYTNLGDDAILWGMVTDLRGKLGRRAIAAAGGPELAGLLVPLEASGPVRAVCYEDGAELARAIEDADLVILGGGGMMYDLEYDAGLARFLTDAPDRQWLYQLAKVAAAARAADRPLMVYGMGVGPLVTESSRAIARFICKQAHAITVRDRASAALLAECGVPGARVQVAADPAISVEKAGEEAVDRLLAESGIGERRRPWIALNLRPWYRFAGAEGEPGDDMERLAAAGGRVVRELADRLGATVVLLPFQRLNDDDARVLEQVRGAAGNPDCAFVPERAMSPTELVGLLGRCDLMVGMRLHSLILAADAGLPFVALAYAEKVREFAAAMRAEEHAHSVDGLDVGRVIASCEALLGDRAGAAARLAERRDEMKRAAGLSPDLAGFLLEAGAPAKAGPPRARAAGKAPETLRALMQIRPDFRERPGGDVVQLEQMLSHLASGGATAEMTGEAAPDLSGYDLVHLINLDRPAEPYEHCLNALAQRKPVVLSTVHTDLSEFLAWGDTDYWELPEPGEGHPRPRQAPPPDAIEARRRTLQHMQRQMLVDWATVCLPNAEVDAAYLSREFGMDLTRTVVVPNAAKESSFGASPDLFARAHGLRDFVLCVGRVEKKKNQLSLVAALRGSGIPLVIVGPPNPEPYFELCRRYADENVHFIHRLTEEELCSAYAAAKVHALVSWVELPGLTTLEAAAAGCNIVSTDRGSPREYLGDMAWYCDPRDVESIRRAVVAAHEAPRSERLRERVRERYTWRRAAERTREGYRLALALHEVRREEDWRERERELEVARRHAEFLARLAADRGDEARRMREWGETAEAELKRLQEEFARVTSRRLHRWSAAAARAGWAMLRKLGVKR